MFGVLQGSLLGLFLFLMYKNDRPQQCDTGEVAVYTGDTSVQFIYQKHIFLFYKAFEESLTRYELLIYRSALKSAKKQH